MNVRTKHYSNDTARACGEIDRVSYTTHMIDMYYKRIQVILSSALIPSLEIFQHFCIIIETYLLDWG